MSCYVTFGGYGNRKRIARAAIQWFFQHRKLNRFNSFVHIIDKRLWHQGNDGTCMSIDDLSRPRYFEIEIENRLDNKEQYLTTLFHELRHVEQRLRGDHKQRFSCHARKVVNKWKGESVPPETEYMDEPWEIDAYKMENVFFKEYKQYQGTVDVEFNATNS